MSSWWISVGLKGFVRLLKEVLGLRGGLGTSTGKQGPKEYFLKEKYIYKYWLNLGLGLCVCVFLSDSKWINYLWEDFLPHLLRNTIFFFGRLGWFSWDSEKFSGKSHCLVNVACRRWIPIFMYSQFHKQLETVRFI